MKIASIQLNIAWEDKAENFERAANFIERAKQDNCDLVVLPEMFNTGFSMNADSISEPVNTETSSFLSEIARKHQINLIAGFAEKNADRNENIALFIDRKGQIKSRYIKNYPYSYADEDQYYVIGDEQVIFQLEEHPASLFICYDLRFPELFRKVARQVEIMFVIASWPKPRQMHWETLLKARAIENQCFVVGVNRIGIDGNGLEYGGGSHVYAPSGEDLSRGDASQEYIVTEIDFSEVTNVRDSLPFLNDIKDK